MKLVDKKDIKRLGIFFFYDKDGVVDDYVMYMLHDMVQNTTQNIVVCNGKLNEEGKNKFQSLPNTDLLVRENKGFDVWAYKSALEYYGWNVIDTYDEIFMYNFTIMGPIGHFSTMFEDMDKRDIDFWGMTIHNGAPFDPWGNMEDGMIPIHIQSHFIAVRNDMIRSEQFHKYWDERPMINRYEDAVGLHEAIFTKTFEKAGYKWDVYVDTKDLIGQTFYPLFNMPVDLIKNRKCPIFKRKLFINDFKGTIQENANLPARELYDYLKNETDFDTDMIIKHLLRSANLRDLINGLNLNYVLDETCSGKKSEYKKTCGIFVSTVAWENHFNEYIEFLKNIPDDVDVYLAVEEKHKNFEKDNVQVSCIDKDVEKFDLLMYFEDKIKAYDYVGIIDSYDEPDFPTYNVLSAREFLYREMLESKEYIEQIRDLFDKEERLGMLIPNPPMHGEYRYKRQDEWLKNYKQIKQLAEEYQLMVDVNKEKESPAALGNCCWVSTDVLKTYYSIHNGLSNDWNYLLPLVAQHVGKFTATVCPNSIAQNIINTFYACAGRTNDGYYNLAAEVYYDTGNGFRVEDVKNITYKVNAYYKEKVEVKLHIPNNTKYIRFDPCEGFMCVCSNIKCDIEDAKIHNTNGIRFGKEDLFLTKDPQYIIEADFSNVNTLEITMDNISVFWSENGLSKEMGDIFKEREELVGAVQHLLHDREELENKSNAEIDGLKQNIKQLEDKIKADSESAKQVTEQLTSQKQQLENEISMMKASRSWRWTAWLRKEK